MIQYSIKEKLPNNHEEIFITILFKDGSLLKCAAKFYEDRFSSPFGADSDIYRIDDETILDILWIDELETDKNKIFVNTLPRVYQKYLDWDEINKRFTKAYFDRIYVNNHMLYYEIVEWFKNNLIFKN
jgi:hypothetical protein